MLKIGLIAMSGKPVHAGHIGLIELAAKDNDEVELFVSLSDRKRPGEIPILGSDMEIIWKRYLEPELPHNVNVTYGGSPVGNVYKVLEEANAEGEENDNIYVIYSDPEDMAKNYPEAYLQKYGGTLMDDSRIILKPILRSQTVNVSGTAMRKFIETGDKLSFIKNMPKNVNAEAIWNILSTSTKNAPIKKSRKKNSTSESLLRDYIRFLF